MTPVSDDVAVRQQYGGRHSKSSRFLGYGAKPNAYMLVYVRRDLVEGAEVEAESELAEGELLPPRVRQTFEKALRAGRSGARGRRGGAMPTPAAAAKSDVESYLEDLFA